MKKTLTCLFIIVSLVFLPYLNHNVHGKDKKTACSEKIIYTNSKKTVKWDHNCDGKIELCRTTYYNKHGQKNKEEMDRDCDGKIDSCHSWAYDDQNRKEKFLSDRDCDGNVDVIYFYHYDLEGNMYKTMYPSRKTQEKHSGNTCR